MKLNEKIMESFKKGEELAKKNGTIKAFWVDYFNFKFDPFVEELGKFENLEKTFVNYEQILKELGEYIGGSKYTKNFYHIGLIGPKGSGKTSILEILNNYATINYETLFYDVKFDRILSPNNLIFNVDPVKELQLNCVFLDNCYPLPKLKVRINQRKKFPGVLIISVSPSIANEIDFDRMIKISPITQEDIILLLKNRVKLAGDSRSLPDEFYETVAKCSVGNPLRALQVAKGLIQILFNFRNDEAKYDSLFKKHINEFNKIRNKIAHGWANLSTKEIKIIDILLKREEPSSITPRELGVEIEGGRTLAWKYLEKLVEKEYLNKFYRGKSSIYELKVSIRIMLETLHMGEKI